MDALKGTNSIGGLYSMKGLKSIERSKGVLSMHALSISED
jgi:hypothetical protein